MRLERTGPRMCGRLGPGDPQRLPRMANGLPTTYTTSGVTLAADGGVVWSDGTGASWSPRPLPTALQGPHTAIARRYDAASVTSVGDEHILQAGISGAVPLYVDTGDDGVHFSSSLDPLVRTRRTVRPDWDGWAHMLAAGAPLDGRTVIEGIRRLRPWEDIAVGQGYSRSTGTQWPWLDATPTHRPSVRAVQDALDASVREITDYTPLAPMLSGGWDSRILTTLATRHQPDGAVTARTTSSDTGTVMEELIASQVSERLGIRHRILMPSRELFGADVQRFAEAVDYQTSFHIWFVPVQRDLDRSDGTVLDGLGGGVFLGGAFPDPPGSAPIVDRRFNRLTHYLSAAPEILHKRAIESIRERTRTAFELVAKPLLDHPFASTFTAYLNRTVPGISLAPYGLLAASTTVATPFLDDRLVSAALQFTPAQHAEGRLYPRVLARFEPALADQPTAEQLAPWPRPHPRRISSPEAAAHIRRLVLSEPVRYLISDELARAELPTWSRLLSTTGGQHLLRGLAVMSLWFDEYADHLDGSGVEQLHR